jgi:iron complex transport system ATP-binding protein
MAILEVKNLQAGYGNGAVIQDISFSLEKGTLVTILGPNGSGKTTLIKALQGLLKDASGKVRVAGADLFRMNRREIAQKISFVPQIFDSAFDFTVMEVVSMGRYTHQTRLAGLSSSDKRIIQEVLAMVEVSHLKDRKMAHLSGGERQRVLIARALSQDTPLLFLDEPSSHLDINYGVEIFQILERLREEREKTILSTEHNINLVIPYSQQIIFLKRGKIQSQGEPGLLITKENIKQVFQADVEIRENLASKLPEISLIPRQPGKK